MIGKTSVSFVIEIHITAVTKRSGEFVLRLVSIARSFGGDQMVVPLVSLHREEDVEAGVGQ